MTGRKLAKHAAIVVASLLFGFIAGFIAATATSPFWGWFESATGIESLGHSGPADWVFELMLVLAITAVIVALEWIFRERPLPGKTTSGKSPS